MMAIPVSGWSDFCEALSVPLKVRAYAPPLALLLTGTFGVLCSRKGVTAMLDSKKIALITGANKGIGFEIARQLGAQGIKVLVGTRDQTRGEEAARRLQSEGIDVSAVHLDVTDQVTINRAASFIDKTYGKLDILVNNAGISLKEGRVPPSELDIEVYRKTYETNVFGVFAVTKAMLPLLRRSNAGRIVNLSSPVGSLTLNSDPASFYAQMPPLLLLFVEDSGQCHHCLLCQRVTPDDHQSECGQSGIRGHGLKRSHRLPYSSAGGHAAGGVCHLTCRWADGWIFRGRWCSSLVKVWLLTRADHRGNPFILPDPSPSLCSGLRLLRSGVTVQVQPCHAERSEASRCPIEPDAERSEA